MGEKLNRKSTLGINRDDYWGRYSTFYQLFIQKGVPSLDVFILVVESVTSTHQSNTSSAFHR